MKMNSFDYTSPAEVYTAGRRRGGRLTMDYRRFDTAAKAIRYSIEELPGACLSGTALEVDGERYRHAEIRKLYQSRAYPLPRRA